MVFKPLSDKMMLCFSSDFPDSNLAGQSIVLDPNAEGKTIWWIGRAKFLQFGSKKTPVDITIRGQFISRAHCTIFYQFNQWYLMDGIYFPIVDEEMTTVGDLKPGEYKPSHNGTWVDGEKLQYRDPVVLQEGSKIIFGGYGYHAIASTPDQTIGCSDWESDDWPDAIPISQIEEKEAPSLNPKIERQLIEEAKSKVEDCDSDIENQWEIIYRVISDFSDWALGTPKNIHDLGFRVFILALIAALIYRISVLIEMWLRK